MLNGKKLGQAIAEAIKLKKASGSICHEAEVARHFGIRQPSLADWKKRGTISKEKLPELWRYFSDVVEPKHWGLKEWPGGSKPAADETPTTTPELAEDRSDLQPRPEPEQRKHGVVAQKKKPTTIRIEEHDVSFAMGTGQVAPDFPEVIRIWEVTYDWLREFLPNFRGNPNNLKIARGIGDCLLPFYNSGDQLLIDTSYYQQVPRMTARYAFRWEGLLYAKELRPLGAKGADAFERDGVKAFSIDYEKDDFMLIAKIEKAWIME